MKSIVLLVLLTSLSLTSLSYSGTVEKYFNINNLKFRLKMSYDDLRKLKGINPHKPITIKSSPSAVLKKVEKELIRFKRENNIKELYLRKVGLVRYYAFDENDSVWLWEVKYGRDNANYSFQKISFYVTNDGEVLVPQRVKRVARGLWIDDKSSTP